MQYVRPVDFSAFPDEFTSQLLADRTSGLDSCVCFCTRVPPGKRTSIGLHTHPVDQIYFILSGTMNVQVAGETYQAGPRTLVYLPAGVPHMNWNEGAVDELHFECIVPAPTPPDPLYTPAASPSSTRTFAKSDLIRPVDESRFPNEPFSWITLGDRASGIGSLSLGLFRVLRDGHAPPLHAHHFDQIYYVISGTMQLRIGFERHQAHRDSLVVLPAGMPHTNWNEDAEAVYFLNLRVPEPAVSDQEEPWDIAVEYKETPGE